MPGDVNPGEVMVWLRDNLGADAILCNGAGNFNTWLHRFYRVRRFASAARARSPARWATACRRRSAMKRLYPDAHA